MNDVVAAAVPLVLDGVEYRLTPLTDSDISELDNWLRQRFIADARAACPNDEAALKVAMDRAMSITWLSGEGAKVMATLDGVARLVWQSTRTYHSDVTYEQFRKIVFANPQKSVAAFNDAWELLTPRSLPKSKKRKRPPKQKRRKRKRTGR